MDGTTKTMEENEKDLSVLTQEEIMVLLSGTPLEYQKMHSKVETDGEFMCFGPLNVNHVDEDSIWKKELNEVIRKSSLEKRINLLGLLFELERKAKDFIGSGEMDEGAVIGVPLESGAFINIHFFKDCFTAEVIDREENVGYGITKDDYFRRDFKYLMGAMNTLEAVKFGIGPKIPDEFHRFLSGLKKGDSITFDNGISYSCEGGLDHFLLFKLIENDTPINDKMMKNTTIPPEFSVDTENEFSVQAVYRVFKNPDNWEIRVKCGHENAWRKNL